jgi:putative transposase
MDLKSNQTFQLLQDSATGTHPAGFYRVIFDEPEIGITVCVCIQRTEPHIKKRVGRNKLLKTKHLRKKPPSPLIGELIWMERTELLHLHEEMHLKIIEIERESIYFKPLETPKDIVTYDHRLHAMKSFLDLERLKEGILVHHGLGGLVREAIAASCSSRTFIYKQWSKLCRLGITDISLRPRHDRCGAPQVLRPCDPDGRKKPGVKTKSQKLARALGTVIPSGQPGMSTLWRATIMAADARIKTPVKPRLSKRYTMILNDGFAKDYIQKDDKIEIIPLAQYCYPSIEQVKRVLEVDTPLFTRLLNSTTSGHFKRSLRGLNHRNWQGVAGPGHTWAIDSTVADIYLRSSLNRAWIVGRPIVYIIVDVWSTAIVGFYVCLTGPSWDTAKVSLFNATADPNLLGEMWGYHPILSLHPFPTMCYALMCDRGEYLSKGASKTAIKLIPCMSYAPPYRPDLKGLVEVLHRIEKDQQFLFMPGAMDARRAEYDLRKSHPAESAMTVREYVQFLHLIFSEYNVCADRARRVDAHMAAAGVFPSPAGLWRYGHAAGIGFRREILPSDLISTLLPSETASVGRSGVMFAGNDYQSDVVKAEQWSTIARNIGGWQIPINHYPGSFSRIWTPNTSGSGLLELAISDQAKTSADVTYEEFLDSLAYTSLHKDDAEHTRTLGKLDTLRKTQALKEKSIRLTKEALTRSQGATPTFTEARLMEVASKSTTGSEKKTAEVLKDEVMDAYLQMLQSVLASADGKEEAHE